MEFSILILFNVFLGYMHITKAEDNDKTDLYIGCIFPLTMDVGHRLKGDYVGIQLALEDINKSTDILPNHTLKIICKSSLCDPGSGMRGLFELLYEPPTKLIILGGTCSTVSAPIAAALPHWNLLQVSPMSAAPGLSDRVRYPNFFRTCPSYSYGNKAIIALLKIFKWRRLGVLYTDMPLYTEVTIDLKELAYQQNITEVISEGFKPSDVKTQMQMLKNKGIRVFFLLAGRRETQMAVCEAYKAGVSGPRYVWILTTSLGDRWWAVLDGSVDCTTEQIYQVINGYFTYGFFTDSFINRTTIAGITRADYIREYNKIPLHPRQTTQLELYGDYAYDAAWAVALALDVVVRSSSLTTLGKSLTNFTYSDRQIRDVLYQALSSVSFTGVSGLVRFEDGERNGIPIRLSQMHEKKMVDIYLISEIGSIEYLADTHFPDHVVPRDRQGEKHLMLFKSPVLLAIMSVLSGLGVIFAILCLAFNINHRKLRYIKMSSPNLNNVTVLGCCVCYCAVPMLGMDPDDVTPAGHISYLCNASPWLLCLGFSMAFGGLLSKTWRVHAIFTSVTPNKKAIKDVHLLVIVGGLLLVDIVTLVVWIVVDPLSPAIKHLHPEVNELEDVMVYASHIVCQCVHLYSLLAALFIYKGVLLLYGAILAWETRKVKIPDLNDSRYIGISIYNVFIISVIGVPIVTLTEQDHNVAFLMTACFVLYGTTFTLGSLFVPKILKVLLPSSVDELASAGTSSDQKQATSENITHYKELVRILRNELEEKSKIIGDLKKNDDKGNPRVKKSNVSHVR